MLKSINGLNHFIRITLRIYPLTMLIFLLLAITQSCSGLKHRKLQKKVSESFQKGSFNHHHSGFLVFDPQAGDTIYKRSSDQYYIPASNAKIFTLYSSLELIQENTPIMQYLIAGDTLYFEGLGNPTTLHPYFKDSTAVKFISEYPVLVYIDSNFKDDLWPAGWSWEDYDRYFSPERSGFPIYGNVVQITSSATNRVLPEYFSDSILIRDAPYRRSRIRNQFYLPENAPDSLEIPIKLRPGLQAEMLEDALGRQVNDAYSFPNGSKKVLYGSPRDSILQRMMYESDNFLAEQMLLVASSALSDSLSSRAVITYMKENKLSGLKQLPRWVDGSGLSRYNLFTPESIVHVLNLLYTRYNMEIPLTFFPAGGISGTLRDEFRAEKAPWIFAKTGSMGNIYCISGYLKTGSGKILIFSFMNNNFTASQAEIRQEVRKVLETLKDSY